MSRLLTTQDLADLLGWKVGTVYQRRYLGMPLPPAIEIGQTIRYRQEDVEAWILSYTTTQDHDSDIS